jgi:nucleotide-binding universal stress UspA family protein
MQPFVQSVFHATDGSPESEPAFAHALAIALARQARLTLLNVQPGFDESDWRRFPRVRETLERWRLLEPGSERSEVFERLGVDVKKVGVGGAHPSEAILDYLGDHRPDLVVLATEQREGMPRFLHASVAQRVARAAGVRALFVPKHGRGFVAPATGNLSLQRLLVPIASHPSPSASIEIATRFARGLGERPTSIYLLHVGNDFPPVDLPESDEWSWHRLQQPSGDPVDRIVAVAQEIEADLIVMTTDGRESFLDRFRGSHAERVVRGARCPVATIPVAKGG